MLQRFLFLVSCLTLSFSLSAQITFSGTVAFTDPDGNSTAIADYPVEIIGPDSVEVTVVNTDEEGVYTYTTTAAAPGELWFINTFDPCIFILFTAEVLIVPDQLNYTVDIAICDGIAPPNPSDSCFAIIDALPLFDDPLTVAFSAFFGPDDNSASLSWDFGDGNESSEINPIHTYEQGGDYDVTLTLASDSCSVSTVQTVSVFDPADCECPDTLAPVCVYNDFGFIITFDNACLAECAGFGPNQYFYCDSDCFCPTFNAPICVVDDSGDTLTFTNHCFAECEGYGPDDWFDCTPLPDCDCDDEPFDQICIDIFGVTIPFNNACEALCAGFTQDMFINCDTINCGCPDYYEPVCLVDNLTGDTISYDNFCLAGCAGVDYDELFYCDEEPPGCLCPDIYDPVCVVTDFGDTISFPNPCEAECAGFGPDTQFDCGPNFCDFPDFPVCSFDTITGMDIQFNNLCDAIAAGIPTELLFPCFTEPECVAAFDFLVSPDDSLTVEFFNQSFSIDSVVSINWEFGDGNFSEEENPVHTYLEAGIYPVFLTVTGADGCTAATAYDVVVGDPNPPSTGCFAFFFFEQPDSNDLLTFQFIDFTGFGSEAAYFWEFGDGSSSNEQNPLYTFPSAGQYQVALTVITPDGCESSIEILVNAGENIWYGDLECRAWFLPVIIAEENYVSFLNLSSYDAISFAWDFGDGTVSTSRDVDHVYAEAGIYEITLTIVTANGCENTYSATIDLHTGGFTSNPQFSLLSSLETLAPAAISKLTVAPNPAVGQIQVSWKSASSGPYSYQLYDLNGRSLLQGNGRAINNDNSFTLDLSPATPGIYYLQIQSGNALETVRIVKAE